MERIMERITEGTMEVIVERITEVISDSMEIRVLERRSVKQTVIP